MSQQCPHSAEVNCQDCRMNSLCLPFTLELDEVNRINDIVQRGDPLHKGQYVYNCGDKFGSVYVVRSGAIKTYHLNDQGMEQVTGFYLPGETFGMDGIAHSQHINSAIALETTAICEVPFDRLEDLSITLPSLQRHFFKLMSREITYDQRLIAVLIKNSAEERLATLLLNISARNAKRSLSRVRFRLPMSRADIGNYLGLSVETVSRTFTRLQKQAILEVDKKEIKILDIPGLQQLANT
ncbi:MAG: fumarate/nitrate reduction transcriptional regulator Fnr [Porticoccaceae bacterium]|nr:fumarate/nitrate reduction transcriptional regulator Fnr [Porticoccaceae bacterium]